MKKNLHCFRPTELEFLGVWQIHVSLVVSRLPIFINFSLPITYLSNQKRDFFLRLIARMECVSANYGCH